MPYPCTMIFPYTTSANTSLYDLMNIFVNLLQGISPHSYEPAYPPNFKANNNLVIVVIIIIVIVLIIVIVVIIIIVVIIMIIVISISGTCPGKTIDSEKLWKPKLPAKIRRRATFRGSGLWV